MQDSFGKGPEVTKLTELVLSGKKNIPFKQFVGNSQLLDEKGLVYLMKRLHFNIFLFYKQAGHAGLLHIEWAGAY